MDKDPRAAKAFYRAVRAFAETTQPWQEAIFYQVNPDEARDLSLVSRRVYGRRDEYLTVLAAAGLSTFDQELRQITLILPTESQLMQMKRQAGFESIASRREDGAPTWAVN